MEPQVKKIFNKLPKTELATEKVELALVDDAKEAIKVARSFMNAIEKDGKQYLTLYRRVQDNGDRLMRIFDVLDNQEKKLDQAAKNLGVKIPELSQLDKVMNEILRMRKTYTF